MDEIEKQFVK